MNKQTGISLLGGLGTGNILAVILISHQYDVLPGLICILGILTLNWWGK